MRVSEQWLREWVNPDVQTAELVAQLTMAGLEVDAVEPAAPPFEGIVVGLVEAAEQHPNADKLRVCQVNVGGDEPLSIVCGAANVAAGQKVPVAVVGAVLPGNFKIKKAKLRGVTSQGMICSASELGMAESSDGILVLPATCEVGVDVRAALALDDQEIEVDLTPNRGDCLCVAGIAREVGVINRAPLTIPQVDAVVDQSERTFAVSLTATDGCPRYVGRAIEGLDPHAETPLWMQEKLRRSGVRSLGPLVDITNYVLLELGQPMHAFDLDKLRDGIGVRWSREGEELALLNGETAKLDGDTLLITDGDVPVAMAGIIGGDSTAVGDDTTNIFLESAFFAPVAIAGRARRYGLHTDASHRFERGVDPQQQRRAIERATQLLIEIAGGKAGPIVEALDQQQLPTSATVLLRRQRIELVLGIPMEDGEIVDILQRLGMDVVAVDGGWQVAAPSYRFDINIEEDLLEELARIHGYENLPNTRSHAEQAVRPRSERTNSAVRIANCLVDIDYQEAITYSFVDPKLQAMLDPDFEPIPLANPISSDMAVMRTSLWPGLVAAATYNLNRQQDRVRLFETGLRFRKAGDTTLQEAMIAGVCSGPIDVERWDGERHGVDFFDAKADVEVLLSLTGDASAFAFEVAEHPALHPGQSARIMKQGEVVGWLGALHPSHSSDLDVKQPIYLFELSLSSIQTRKMPVFSEISKFPAIRRDLALVVAEEISAQQLIDCMRSTETKWLRDLQLFDIYRGKGVASGKKSIALGLTLQNPSRTLTDTEVDKIIQDILQKLRDELEADLRN